MRLIIFLTFEVLLHTVPYGMNTRDIFSCTHSFSRKCSNSRISVEWALHFRKANLITALISEDINGVCTHS